MPIKRFGSYLLSKDRFDEYMSLLRTSFNPGSVKSLMCRNMLSIDWQGYVYDCDFNQMLGMKITNKSLPLHIADLCIDNLPSQINVAEHCYGCTAGQGSSCGGALV
jgi:radical SAM/Cys-rich protein